ncbi:DUF4097 family beta strand repeat-containing protein [Mesobacillus maritimus]|uniref:DUF4097 family beta strand repeat-containing protein n=1 Tax=Mesobacillus maritimus TaxID=1643336 RepID=UPI00203F1B3E|nr:DUF4097 domain-containing protein [Mesobacillus maritimus]MCM3585152.1 DUF4097 family beta strand repeat-containing protein [Mesobacillus maritimus]
MKEERKKILKMVEEGRLTVEEALFLIEELEKKEKSMEDKKAELITELSTTVKQDHTYQGSFKKEEATGPKLQSAVDKIVDFVDSAFKKIKDVDLDLNFGQSVDITHIFQQPQMNLTQIDVDLANGSLQVIPWDQEDVRAECAAKVYRVNDQEEARRKLLDEVLFTIDGQKLIFSNQQKWMKLDVTLYIPRLEYEKVRIRLFNGAISGENLKVTDLKAKTANGKVSLQNVSSKKVESETANGAINVLASHIYDLEAETLNGAINVEGDFNTLDLQSFSGSITCTVRNQNCESIEATSATASVNVQVPVGTPVRGELKTNLGQFKLELEGIEILEEKSEMVQKMLRFTTRELEANPTRIFAESKSGTISLSKTI